MIQRVARASAVKVEIIKIEKLEEISGMASTSTPAVIIDGKVVHSGGLPSHDEVKDGRSPALWDF